MSILEKIIQEIEKVMGEHPYKVPGKPETYSSYNEAWQGCADRIECIIERLIHEEMKSADDEILTLEELKIDADKQKPMKPDYEGDGYADDGKLVYDTWICPNCGKRYEVDYDDYAYCPKCGRAIDLNERRSDDNSDMELSKYNSYPEFMEEMTEESWNDFFTYCIERVESRQAYKSSIYEMHEDLRIFWIKEDRGLGICIGRTYENHNQIIRYYKLGKQEDWNVFKRGFGAMFEKDNS